jgi:nitrate reductase beta subunit
VEAAALRDGIPHDWIQAAKRSPVYDLAVKYKVALPLHPEYRTLPMVWYVPPLSPVADIVHAQGYDHSDPDRVFATIDSLRIPIDYLANLFTAGDTDLIRKVLRKLTAIRAIQRAKQLGMPMDDGLAASVDSTPEELEDLYRLLAIGKYADRYVIPPAHAEEAGRLMGQHEQLFCSLDYEGGPGMGGGGPAGPHGISSFQPTGAGGTASTFRADDGHDHFNLVGAEAGGHVHPHPHGSDPESAVPFWRRKKAGGVGDLATGGGPA